MRVSEFYSANNVSMISLFPCVARTSLESCVTQDFDRLFDQIDTDQRANHIVRKGRANIFE